MGPDSSVKGIASSPGVATGAAYVASKRLLELEGVPKDSILVVKRASPDVVLIIDKIKAIVTEVGGKTSHIALIARELGIPCITGVKQASSLIKSGTIITVNGHEGVVTLEEKHFKKI